MNLKNWIIKNKESIVIFLYALLEAALIYYCLELGNKNPLLNGFFYTIVNILTVFVIQSVIYMLARKWWIAGLVTGIPLTLLSIANYYTLIYRNSPISTQDIHNLGTTISVIDSYNFPLSVFVLGIIIFLLLQIAVVIQLFKHEKNRRTTFCRAALKTLVLALFCSSFTYFMYFSENPIKPRNTFVWSWEDSYYKFGYAASSIEVFQNSMNMVDMPKDYSPEKLKEEQEVLSVKKTKGKTPDVILILNETFYDMRDLLDFETDVPVMPFVDSIKTGGRAVVAGTGGGTNKSEYELLTSNSLQLMPAITPFNYLDFESANSIVSYLKALGYTTWGGHPAEEINYKRGIVYPQLGFDSVLFREEFNVDGRYGQRPYATDEGCFEKMISDYENMGDAPRFQYLLTMQNHGGWELNPPQEDIVHSLTDFGDYTDDMDEFLSCINKTDSAFKSLTEYFENVDRDVIICMVGDHAPSFATQLPQNIGLEETFALRSTPYVIWTNFEADLKLPSTTSMPFLVPLMLDAADMPLSLYYSHLLTLSEKTPVLTAFNLYKTANGDVFNYKDDSKYKREIDIYFDMVYNNSADSKNRMEEIFKPSIKK